MRKIFLFIIVSAFFLPCLAQVEQEVGMNFTVKTNRKAGFPGGVDSLITHVNDNIIYPAQTKGLIVDGQLSLNFTVDTSGQLSDFDVLGGIGYGVDEAVIEVLKKTRFLPLIQNGHPLPSEMMITIPVRFNNK